MRRVQRLSPFLGHPVYRHAPMLNDVLGYEPPPDSCAPMLDHNAARIAWAFVRWRTHRWAGHSALHSRPRPDRCAGRPTAAGCRRRQRRDRRRLRSLLEQHRPDDERRWTTYTTATAARRRTCSLPALPSVCSRRPASGYSADSQPHPREISNHRPMFIGEIGCTDMTAARPSTGRSDHRDEERRAVGGR